MFGIHDLWLFVLSGLILNITPGPDTAYVVARSMQRGWRGGGVAGLGISFGCLVHIAAAAIGLSALIAASASGFMVVKVIGAAYLIYAGVRMMLSRRTETRSAQAAATPDLTLGQVFWQGALTNILNPKIALFFLALLPQFVDADAPNKPLAFIVLGLVFVFNGTIWNFLVAVFAAKAAGGIAQSRRAQVWLSRTIGAMFIYLGVRIATFEMD